MALPVLLHVLVLLPTDGPSMLCGEALGWMLVRSLLMQRGQLLR